MAKPNLENKFVKRRKALGVSQSQIAEAIGRDVRSISDWENGRRLPELNPRQFANLCLLLQCSIHDLANDFEQLNQN